MNLNTRYLVVYQIRERADEVLPALKDLRNRYTVHSIKCDGSTAYNSNDCLEFYKEYNIDALTVAPYMGEDSVTPFLEYENKWVILLALTSNKGSHDFQLTEAPNGERLFEKVLHQSQQWGTKDNMMYVVGATQGEMFKDIRRIVPKHFLLVPGVGAQGGSLQEVCRYGMNKECSLLINSSRGIIYASDKEDFAEMAAAKAHELQQQMAIELDRFKP